MRLSVSEEENKKVNEHILSMIKKELDKFAYGLSDTVSIRLNDISTDKDNTLLEISLDNKFAHYSHVIKTKILMSNIKLSIITVVSGFIEELKTSLLEKYIMDTHTVLPQKYGL